MNLKQIKNQIGTNLRLRPFPVLIVGGKTLRAPDDLWRLETILDNPTRLRLTNIHTHHAVELQPDNVREYRTPDFLILRCQLIVNGQTVDLEPIVTGYGDLEFSNPYPLRLGAGTRDQRKSSAPRRYGLKVGVSAILLLTGSLVLPVVKESFTSRRVSLWPSTIETEIPGKSIVGAPREKPPRNAIAVKQAVRSDMGNIGSGAVDAKLAKPPELERPGIALLKKPIDTGSPNVDQSRNHSRTTELMAAPATAHFSSTSVDTLLGKTGGQGFEDPPIANVLSSPYRIKTDGVTPTGNSVLTDLIAVRPTDEAEVSSASIDSLLAKNSIDISELLSSSRSLDTIQSAPKMDLISLRADPAVKFEDIGITFSGLANSASESPQLRFSSGLDAVNSLSEYLDFHTPGLDQLTERLKKSDDPLDIGRSRFQLPSITRNCLAINSVDCK